MSNSRMCLKFERIDWLNVWKNALNRVDLMDRVLSKYTKNPTTLSKGNVNLEVRIKQTLNFEAVDRFRSNELNHQKRFGQANYGDQSMIELWCRGVRTSRSKFVRCDPQ